AQFLVEPRGLQRLPVGADDRQHEREHGGHDDQAEGERHHHFDQGEAAIAAWAPDVQHDGRLDIVGLPDGVHALACPSGLICTCTSYLPLCEVRVICRAPSGTSTPMLLSKVMLAGRAPIVTLGCAPDSTA